MHFIMFKTIFFFEENLKYKDLDAFGKSVVSGYSIYSVTKNSGNKS